MRIVVKCTIIALMLLAGMGLANPAAALDNSKKPTAGAWSRCKLDCDNAGGEPIVVRYCKQLCDRKASGSNSRK
jgi:hypothetical protein